MGTVFSELMEKSCKKLGSLRLTKKSALEQERMIRAALVSSDIAYGAAAKLSKKIVSSALASQGEPGSDLSSVFVKIIEQSLSRPMPPRPFGGRVVLFGPNGAGKTTTAAKIAKLLSARGRVAVVACDHVRPAAAVQLEKMASISSASFFELPKGDVRSSLESLAGNLSGYDHVIFDTAGVQDLVPLDSSPLPEVVRFVRPSWKLMVCDAAGGQQVCALAGYLSPLGIDASVITKTDGDAMGGAALTVVEVTDRPIVFVGTGEKPDDLEEFSPARMASRIMGRGDLAAIASRARKVGAEIPNCGKFDFDSMLGMFSAVRAMGGASWVAKMMPGTIGRMAERASDGMDRAESIIFSMSRQERKNPSLLSERSRVSRIAAGCGQDEGAVRELVNRLELFGSVMSPGAKRT